MQDNCKLVSRIQKRLVRILCGFPKSPRKTIEPKPIVPRPVFVPLEDEAAKSSHQLTWNDTAKGWRCSQCAAFGAKSSSTIRPWLSDKCIPVPSDAKGPVRLPFGIPHLIGANTPHASHALYFYRGYTFCDMCGSCAVNQKSTARKEVCRGRCTTQTAQQRKRLKKGEHPQSAKHTFPIAETSFFPARFPAIRALPWSSGSE